MATNTGESTAPETDATDESQRAGTTPPAEPERRTEAERRERTPFTQQVGRVIVIVAAALFGIFAFTNLQPVEFDWIFGSSEVTVGPDGEATGGVPLIILLLASFALGAIVGVFGMIWQRRR